jgi:hypothetical protein
MTLATTVLSLVLSLETVSSPAAAAAAPVAPVLVAAADAPPNALPADGRLAAVKPALERQLARARAAGLPTDVVVAKVREGLAKNVAPDRIQSAVERLVTGLEEARAFAAERTGRAPSHALVAALAKARLGGVDLAASSLVLKDVKDDATAARAVSVLTDLASRGYPTERAAFVVRDVGAREPEALGRLPFALDNLRQQQAMTPLQAVDTLARSLVAGTSLDVAARRSVEEAERAGNGRSPSHVDDADGKPGRGLGLGHDKDKPERGRGKGK